MGWKRHGITQSQTLGIIWLSIASVLIFGVVFFCSHHKDTIDKNDTTKVTDTKNLTLKEDSVYNSRQYKKYTTKEYQHQKTEQRIDSTFYSQKSPIHTRQPLMVDINEADSTTLLLLHGIGPVFANRIIKYRDRLGGFTNADQLLEVYGMTPKLVEHIKPYLNFNNNIHKIQINTIELKQLVRHPYIEYYQARDIVSLRNNGIRFNTVYDLRTVPSMNDTTLERLLPYIAF